MTGKTIMRLGKWAAVAVALAGAAYGAYVGWQLWRERTTDRRLGRHDELIRRHADANRLPAELVRAVIRVESAGRPTAVSNRNAKGLMQVTPPAEQDALARLGIGKGDLFDPEYNIRIGTAYLRQLVDRFDGDAHLALAAYNWGPTNVARLRRAHPGLTGQQIVEQFAPPVTRRYCLDILGGRPLRLGTN